jgi:hypothetical protein
MRERVEAAARQLGYDGPTFETTPWGALCRPGRIDQALEATKILTMSDWQAITVLDEAVRRGIKVPEHMSVLGFDGTAEAARGSAGPFWAKVETANIIKKERPQPSLKSSAYAFQLSFYWRALRRCLITTSR